MWRLLDKSYMECHHIHPFKKDSRHKKIYKYITTSSSLIIIYMFDNATRLLNLYLWRWRDRQRELILRRRRRGGGVWESEKERHRKKSNLMGFITCVRLSLKRKFLSSNISHIFTMWYHTRSSKFINRWTSKIKSFPSTKEIIKNE